MDAVLIGAESSKVRPIVNVHLQMAAKACLCDAFGEIEIRQQSRDRVAVGVLERRAYCDGVAIDVEMRFVGFGPVFQVLGYRVDRPMSPHSRSA